MFCCLLGSFFQVKAQETTTAAPSIRPANFGFGISLFDFTTASRIRQNSLSSIINSKQGAKIDDMAPGVSISYVKGIQPRLDFAASFSYASGRVYLQQSPNTARSSSFVVADASVQAKLLPEGFFMNPFVSGGVGVTVTQGYYGAILPLGAGFRFQITDEAAITLQSQYRVAVTESAGYHFVHGISIFGKL
ncbi:hypothetical protein BUE76_12450 [Cnuella takakiae]|nr:hypothetical protein BUE76_12450 [Cnuella takakiae]